MKSRTLLSLGLSALILGGALAGTVSTQGGTAFASGRTESREVRQAMQAARATRKALASGKLINAVALAETAVRLSPLDAGYRVLLGDVYLRMGRFASARDALSDAIALTPADGHVALSLALAQIATGDWTGARKTIEDHANVITVSDRGLALALAGDPGSAVELLMEAARGPASDAKTRQNLALALALAGRWPEAKSVAAIDVAPRELDQRIMQWADFAHPRAASDQVASLLGVTAVEDAGQPAALALNIAPTKPAVAGVDAYMPGQPPAEAVEAVEAVAAADPAVVPADPEPAPVALASEAAAPSATPAIIFAERSPVIQPIPVASTAKPVGARSTPVPVPAARPTAPVVPQIAKGDYYVQLGAFPSAAVAHDGWTRATRRFPALAGHTPSGMAVTQGKTSFYRLSVGGFARGSAVALCTGYRAAKGNCFVRAGSGDQVAQWVRAPRQLASR